MLDWDKDGTVNKARDRNTIRRDNETSRQGSKPFGERVYTGFEHSHHEYFWNVRTLPRNCSADVALRLYTFFQSV